MKKYFLLFSFVIIGLSGCVKNELDAQKAVDDRKIQAYIAANNIKATKDPQGYYYVIITPGSGTPPLITNTVKVNYTAKFLDDVQFDTGSSSLFLLSGTTQGFQLGLQHIGNGGRIMLILPSFLGYGTDGDSPNVPANAVLVFTIDLLGYY